MNNGMKYTFVCDPNNCDTLIEVTCPSGFDFPNGEVKMFCPCGRQMSYISATIQPINERKEMEVNKEELVNMWRQELELTYGNRIVELENRVSAWQQKAENFENMVESYRNRLNSNQSTVNKIIDNMTHDYWYNPNTDKEEVLRDLCEIVEYTPKKEIQFTAVMHFNGRIDVDLADIEDFDLTEFLSDAYVDVNHGDVVIDDYELYEAEEC